MEVEFIATLSNSQNAITISDGGDTRVRFDIPSSELANAVKLVLLKGKAFKVIINASEE